MIHARHYTLEEASELLPRVVEIIERMRVARNQLGDREARDALSEAGPTNGGGTPGRTVSQGFLAMRDRGLLDFPSLRDGREVYLCWQDGEDAIRFWHEPDAGFGGRRPLDDG